jgi:hypothetical protein
MPRSYCFSIEKQLKERKPKPKDWVPYKRHEELAFDSEGLSEEELK